MTSTGGHRLIGSSSLSVPSCTSIIVHTLIRGASDGEPLAVELRARLLRERLESNARRLEQYVGGAPRPGLTLEAAAEHYFALSSPEMHHLLTVELGWSRQAHEDWLAALAETELLGPG